MPIELSTDEYDDLRIMQLTGTLDAPGAMAIEDQFQELLGEDPIPAIVDLSDVDYISSYGLRMLLTGAKKKSRLDTVLYLAAPNEHVMKIITVAGYDTMFPVYETVEEAANALSGQ